MIRPLLMASRLVLTACGTVQRDRNAPITSVAQLDVNRYLGLWY